VLAKFRFQFTHEEFYAPTGLQHPSYLLRLWKSKGEKAAGPRKGGVDLRYINPD